MANTRDPLRTKAGNDLLTIAMAVVVITVTASVITVFFLADSVRSKVERMAAANSDASQWSLAQVEVDLLALQIALSEAISDGDDSRLAVARQRFDIFYSRVATISDSQQFSELRSEKGAQDALDAMLGFLDRWTVVFDGTDPVLKAALPDVRQSLKALRDVTRSYSLLGVRFFALESDTRREAVASLLARIGVLTFILVLILLLFVFILLWVIRRSAQAERAVASARNRLQEVISTSIDGILTVDRHGLIVDYNGAAERIFGYTRDEAIGQSMADLVIPLHLRKAHLAGMERFNRTGEKHVVGAGLLKLDAMRKDGTVFPVEATIAAVDADGDTIFVSFLRDVSDRSAAEKELVKARDQAVAGEKAKADLLAIMSHEMRTPLNGLLGTMELLQDTKLNSQQQKYLSAMGTSAGLLLSHINNVLSISSAEAGKLDLRPTEIIPDELLSQLVASQSSSISKNGNAITVSTKHAPDRLWADRTRLLQVLLNLLANANKFTQNGQLILECDSVAGGNSVEFRIIDNGVGIAAEDQMSIWEDFKTLDASYSRTTEGSGLGLAISKRIVIAMGGNIGVESELGEGSLFWVRLPVGGPAMIVPKMPRMRTLSKPALSQDVPLGILLIEDNEINRLVARDMLEKAGHRVVEAENGRDGLEAAAKEHFDVILMDISMPIIDGITASRMIHDNDGPNQETPIIALTAHAQDEDIARFRAAGMLDTIVKPLSKNALLHALNGMRKPSDSGEVVFAESVLLALRNQKGPAGTVALIEEFITETNRLAEQCPEAIGSLEEARELSERVHKAAGAAAVFSLQALCSSLWTLENALKEDGHPDLVSAFATFNGIWSQARMDLHQLSHRLSAEVEDDHHISRETST